MRQKNLIEAAIVAIAGQGWAVLWRSTTSKAEFSTPSRTTPTHAAPAAVPDQPETIRERPSSF
jgi:hypothetical protein